MTNQLQLSKVPLWKKSMTGNPSQKMGKHPGIFTRLYQEVRAVYDAKIRNWEIEYCDNIFFVKNAEEIVERVYHDGVISNCSCKLFFDHECGTCMHIEAVKLVLDPSWMNKLPDNQPFLDLMKSAVQSVYNLRLDKVRPIRFVNDDYQIQTVGSSNSIFETPSVTELNFRNEAKKNSYYSLSGIENFDVFTDYGINLFEFQIESIKRMIRNQRTVLVLQMGLGKTLCALACCKILNKQKILIIATNSLKYQWQHEINRLELGSSLVVASGKDLTEYDDQRFLIMSYEMLNRNPDVLKQKFDVLIPDEIQRIRNQESKSWDTMSQVQADFVFALSGTPIQNNINDLISLIQFLNPFELKPDWKFYEKYCITTKARIFGVKPDKLNDLRNRIDRYLINPSVDFDKFKLPDKNKKIIVTKLSAKQNEIHDNYFDMAQIMIAKSMNTPLTWGEKLALNGLLTKARIASTDLRLINKDDQEDVAPKSEKFFKIENLILDICQNQNEPKKVVVYSDWVKTLKLLTPFLDENGIEYVFFTGEVSAKKRDANLKAFINNPGTQVFLSTVGSEGVDGLQFVCNHVIHIEKIWNPMRVSQREGRLVRFLSRFDSVNIYSFETDSGIEEMMNINNGRKYQLIEDMLK